MTMSSPRAIRAELARRDLRRLVLVQRALAEDLARHVDALHGRAPRPPGGQAAVEHAHVAVAHGVGRGPGARGERARRRPQDERRARRRDEPGSRSSSRRRGSNVAR